MNLNHVSCRLLSLSDRSRLITANYVSWGSLMKLYTLDCLCKNSFIFYSWRSSTLVYYPTWSWYLIQHYSHDWYRIVPQYDSHSFVCAYIVEHHLKKKIPRARWHQQGQKKSHASVRNKYRKKRRYRKSGTQIIKCLFTKFIWSHWTKKYLFVSSPKSTRKNYLPCLNG